METLRSEILQRIGHMHDIQRWKLISCATVIAFFLERSLHAKEGGLMLGFLIPSGICFLSDLQYFQNLLMILTIGKFVQSRDRDTDEILVAYERFLHQERKRSRRFNFEITAHIIVSLVVSIAPPLIAAKSAIGRGDSTILVSGAAIGGTAIAVAWIVYFRALLKLRR